MIYTHTDARKHTHTRTYTSFNIIFCSVSENVASAAKASRSWLIYISTDYVFDGLDSPYKANAKPNPLNLYGQTKLQGEVDDCCDSGACRRHFVTRVWRLCGAQVAVRKIKSDAGVLRVPVLYGDVERADESSVTALLEAVQRSASSVEPVPVDDWATRYPTLTADVAFVLRGLAERKLKFCGFFGTWHASGTEAFTKLELVGALLPRTLRTNTQSDLDYRHN
jgi:dTDP-4-dehydrorhamnose reductase